MSGFVASTRGRELASQLRGMLGANPAFFVEHTNLAAAQVREHERALSALVPDDELGPDAEEARLRSEVHGTKASALMGEWLLAKSDERRGLWQRIIHHRITGEAWARTATLIRMAAVVTAPRADQSERRFEAVQVWQHLARATNLLRRVSDEATPNLWRDILGALNSAEDLVDRLGVGTKVSAPNTAQRRRVTRVLKKTGSE